MPPRTEFFRNALRWLWPAALLALAPKCMLCVLAYTGLGAALGLGGSEICSATPAPTSWVTSLAWLGVVAGGLGTFGLLASCQRGRTAPTGSHEQVKTSL